MGMPQRGGAVKAGRPERARLTCAELPARRDVIVYALLSCRPRSHRERSGFCRRQDSATQAPHRRQQAVRECAGPRHVPRRRGDARHGSGRKFIFPSLYARQSTLEVLTVVVNVEAHGPIMVHRRPSEFVGAIPMRLQASVFLISLVPNGETITFRASSSLQNARPQCWHR